ncbi:PAS domain S-box protein [Maridesulfovibrio sp.]|uniref:PAS domain-containing sensor histidine kinase n=1 Tax=Maridesulfovibrio sp. TaxID=2795000 RepID=UPI0029F5CA70|nr:PAS domain S-box protein [Maridesulfovibrio sp.]
MDKKTTEGLHSDNGNIVKTTATGECCVFQNICTAISGIFAVLDKKHNIIYASEDFYKATGTTSDIIGQTIFLIQPPFCEDDTEGFSSSLRLSLNKIAEELIPNRMPLREHIAVVQNGVQETSSTRYISYSNYPVMDEKRDLSCIVFKTEDVTDFVMSGINITFDKPQKSGATHPAPTPQTVYPDHVEDGNYLPRVLLLSTNVLTERTVNAALKEGYKLLHTSRCESALHYVHNTNPTAIIIDLCCPDKINALIDSLRAEKKFANIPVLVTENKTINISELFTKDPMTELLGTPLSQKRVRAHVDRMIAKNQRIQIEQSRLAALVASSEDAIIGAKLDGTITDWNTGAERIFGYTPKEIIGKSVQILVPPDIYADKTKIMNLIAQGEHIKQLETIRLSKDGRRIDVSTSISPIRNHQGTIIGASAITRDITRRKKTEQEMKSQAFLLEEIGQLAKVGGWEFDPQTGRGSWTDETARIYDIDPDITATAELGLSFFYGEHRENIEAALEKAVENGTPYDLELEMTTAKGHKKWIRAICKPRVEDGKVISIRGAFQDITDIKSAELRVRNSEKKLYDILEAISDALVVVNEDGNIVMVNSATIKMFGYSREELLGENINFFVPEPYKKEHTIKCKSYFKSPDFHAPLWNKNISIQTRSGIGVPVDIALSLTSIDGSPHAIASIRDISRRKKAEENLKASETKFRVITENLKELIYRADYKTLKINYVNKAVKDIYGYTPAEWLAKPNVWEENLHPDDKELVLKYINKAVREFNDVKLEYRILDRNGNIHWVHDSMTWEKDESGNPVAILGAMADITEKKLVLIYLEEKEKFLRDILHGIKAAILIIDFTKGIVVDANDEFLRITGKNKEQVIGQSCAKVLQCNNHCPQCSAGGGIVCDLVFKERSRIKKSDGSQIPLEQSFIPVTIHGEKRIVAVLFDVTEQVAIERQLAYAQKLESIGQLAAGLAHEINTPVQYIAGNIDYLKESFTKMMRLIYFCDESFKQYNNDTGNSILKAWDKAKSENDLDFLNEDIPEAFKETLFGVDQVSSIVKAMRNFSHPGSETKQSIELEETIKNIITVSRNEWKYSSDIITDFDPDLPTISCMPGSFNQAVLNILVNAAHANAEAAGTGPKKNITIKTRKKGNVAEISISDSGKGIPLEIQHRIFDPFFTTKEVGKGTGQGLGIVHSVMQKHEGSVSFNSVSGEGTTFFLRFPIDSEL